jgi:hypothetical protein
VLALAAFSALVVVASPTGAEAPPRRVDLSLTAFASMPERFALCASVHPAVPLEVDLCAGADRGLIALTAHAYYRKRWQPSPDVSLGLGPGLGVRAMRFCPYSVCAVSAGPELLLSLEAVYWLREGLGLTAQLDGGLALFWTEAAPGLLQHGFRFPARLLAGVAF